jgi:integrase/recombinase XerD
MGTCRPVSDSEATAMLQHTTNLRDRAIVLFFWRTGYRSSEVSSLRVKDVWDGKKLRDQVHVAPEHMKKGTPRKAVPLHPQLCQALVLWLAQLQQSGYLQPETPLWLSRKKHEVHTHVAKLYGLARETLWRIIKTAAIRAGIEGHVGGHSFRKNFCLKMWDLLQHNILDVQEAMGHMQVSSTQVYLRGAQNSARIHAAILAA